MLHCLKIKLRKQLHKRTLKSVCSNCMDSRVTSTQSKVCLWAQLKIAEARGNIFKQWLVNIFPDLPECSLIGLCDFSNCQTSCWLSLIKSALNKITSSLFSQRQGFGQAGSKNILKGMKIMVKESGVGETHLSPSLFIRQFVGAVIAREITLVGYTTNHCTLFSIWPRRTRQEKLFGVMTAAAAAAAE